MTDNEIIKALKHCANGEHCRFCCFRGITGTVSDCSKNFLDLITRQQAEIERLKEKQEKCFYCTEQANKKISEIKSEAVKEFAERLKKQYAVYNGMEYVKVDLKTLLNTIDNLVKEMVGGNNEG